MSLILTLKNINTAAKLFKEGMKIWIYSNKIKQNSGIGWHPGGIDIQYKKHKLRSKIAVLKANNSESESDEEEI